MAAATTSITVDEFNSLYASQKGYEYWFGEVVQKSMPTFLHGILQALLSELFFEMGYFSGAEVDLRISRDFQPRPDVAASLELESTGYPTKPIDIVAEILSPDEIGAKVIEKCRNYAALGIRQIYVFDPEARGALQWNEDGMKLDPIEELLLTNGKTVTVEEVFTRFDTRLKRRA